MAKKLTMSEMTADEVEEEITGPIEDAAEELRDVVGDLERAVKEFRELIVLLVREVLPRLRTAAPGAKESDASR